ncbi:alginate lyase family protein [Schleiferilactobacillus harbinensis]|uniref:alginate lyase family protein n=1 Tax=Schleiferilactobacillus harbinensis TaxID=304207 RepID=UPI00242BC279|nr:alginate lyase family protein [Schleiferilactobacillus harbinensis]MCI1688346.1 alginate lyase family protein [Schleiferilactobacillus harbinensis]MCI1784386.1 alginate lyase family protein [Schleiferilactobacillus harbinensis]MCI1851337.1 alginate lyase family protein [Schleiferilactobacillus harbinensis]
MKKRQIGWLFAITALLGVLAVGLPTKPVQAATDPALPAITRRVSLKIRKENGIRHPAISVDPGKLVQTRRMLLQGQAPWQTYYAGMVQTDYASRTFKARNLQAGTYDTPANNTFKRNSQEVLLSADGFRAYTQAVMYYLTGDPQYRYNALRLVRTWANMDPTAYQYYPDAHIHVPVPFYYMVSAAELLKYTTVKDKTFVDSDQRTVDMRWTQTDTDKLTTNLINPVMKTFLNANNHYFNQHLYTLTGNFAGAIFKNDQAAYQKYVEQALVNKNTDKPYGNGALAHLFYAVAADDPRNATKQSFIQHLEMGRDQNHAKDDILDLIGIARIINNQRSKVDAKTGQVVKKHGVDPYQFLNKRLLSGVEQFYQYNLGSTIPWVQFGAQGNAQFPAWPSDGVNNLLDYGGPISSDGRGRLNKFFSSSELFDYYRYQEGMSLKQLQKTAPAVVQQATHLNDAIFYEGTGTRNFWGSYSDNKMTEIGAEYWLSMPRQKAQNDQARPAAVQAATSDVAFSQFGTVLDQRLAVKKQDYIAVRAAANQKQIQETAYDQSYPKDKTTVRGGHQLALAGLVKSATGQYGLRIRSNGTAKLLVSASNEPGAAYQTIALPDTHGQWVNLAYSDPAVHSAYTDFYAVIGDSAVTVDFAALTYFNQPSGTQSQVPTIAISAAHSTVLVGEQTTWPVTITNAAKQELLSGPAGMTLAADGRSLQWQPTKAGTYEAVIAADNDTTVVTKILTLTVAQNRQAAYDQVHATVSKQPYTPTSVSKLTQANDAVVKLLSTGSTDDFLAALAAYRTTIQAAELINPTLSDGSLNYAAYPDMVTTYVGDQQRTINLTSLLDNNPGSTNGDFKAPQIFDFGPDFRVRPTSFMIQARTGFPNRSQGTNVYGSLDGKTWTKLTEHMTACVTTPQTLPIAKEKQTAYRYLKFQVDEPGLPTDPAYPGVIDYGEIRVFGERELTTK